MSSLRWAVVLAAGCLVTRAASLAPRASEIVYGHGLFPPVAWLLGRLSGWTRIDLAQILVAMLAVAVPWFLIARARRAIRARSLREGFGPGYRYVAFLALCVWGFQLIWGLNYARPLLGDKLGLPKTTPDVERLARVTRLLAAETNRSYLLAESSRQLEVSSASRLRVTRDETSDRLAAAYGILQPSTRRLRLTLPKYPRLASWVLTRVGISGFYFPLTGEATVDGAMPDAAIPFTTAHEMAHQRGTAREDEANFLAFLACRETGLAAAQYSGALEAFGLAARALWQASPESLRALSGVLDPGPRSDRAAIRDFWERHQGPAMTVSEKVNDAYLKANAQRGGVESYDRAVELLVALEAAGGFKER